MKKPSTRTLQWIGLATVLLIVLVLWLTVQRSQSIQSSLESGNFEAYYASAIESLQIQTRSVRNKLRASLPGELEILPEALLRKPRPALVTSEIPKETSLANITLRGIYWSDTLPLAEINDRLCKTGDEIGGFTLEEIQPYQILLSDSTGSTQTVSLIKENFNTEQTK